jgi:hypothetical protein
MVIVTETVFHFLGEPVSWAELLGFVTGERHPGDGLRPPWIEVRGTVEERVEAVLSALRAG